MVLPGLFMLGVVVFHFLVRPILGAEPLNQMLLLVGLSLVLQNGALALFSPDTRSVQSRSAYSKIEFGDVIVGIPKLIAFAVSIAITLGALLAAALDRARPPDPRCGAPIARQPRSWASTSTG